MQKLRNLFVALMLTLAIGVPAFRVLADPTNLINNPSVETADASGSNPVNWTFNSWGNNTSTSAWSSDAYDGSHSLNVQTTTRTDGDAKWMMDPVSIQPSTSYDYNDYYKSNVPTELDLEVIDGSGNVSWQYLKTVDPASSWTADKVTFNTPANASKVAVLHILAAVGSLSTDEFSLVATPPDTPTPPNTDGNLLLNPSMEYATAAGEPANWLPGNWGTNSASFTYDNTGHTGTHSVKVVMSSYSSGDAKWYDQAATVTPGASYTYSDYYQANVPTEVVLAVTDSSGNVTYLGLPEAAPAAGWTQYTANFTAPATAKTITVYHLIASVGYLSLDDASLTANTVAPPPTSNTVVPNASLEVASPGNANTPDQWQSNSWGSNTATFSYENTGHTGTHSVKTTISNYVSGDAKWYFNPISTLKPGQQYLMSAWYKSSTDVHVIAMSTDASGNVSYFNLPSPLTVNTTTWQHYQGSFTVPSNSASLTVFMLISSNGWVQTDDYDITPYTPTPFNRGLVTLTFDDGWQATYTNGLPLLKKYGFPSTQFIVSSFIDTPDYMTVAQIKAFQSQGSEIGSHSVDHPDLTTLNSTQLTSELQNSQTTLRSLFGSSVAKNFATPYGAYNANVITQIQKYYRSHRSTDVGFNSKDSLNPYNIRVQNIDLTTTPAQVDQWVNQAYAQRTWLVLVYHQVENTPSSADTYAVSTANLNSELSYIKSKNIPVKTIDQALNELLPQL